MLYMVLYTLSSLPMMPRPGTQALVVSRADKIYISALFASSLVRNNICPVTELQLNLVIQEGGSVSRVNIGRLITTSVTSRHTSMFFKMAGNFLVRHFCKR